MLLRKILVLLVMTTLLQSRALSQYWQQEAHYTIDVTLNDTAHSLSGFEKIVYVNHSPDTLRFIWFHLWPNAYKNDRTAFSDQLLENGNTKFYFSGQEQKGYINRLDFKVNNVTAELKDHPQHIDIAQLVLPTPLPPGGQVTITTPFHVRLPFNFSRGGHDGQSYQVTQWYPKPAVYDRNGWHEMPYLDQGEYFSEFGSYDVRITVPANYVVAATGELKDEGEKAWLNGRAGFEFQAVKRKEKTKYGNVKTIYQRFPASEKSMKTLRFQQDRVHDFAWFADKRFVVKQDTCQLPSGKTVAIAAYYLPASRDIWSSAPRYAKEAIRLYSAEVGEYPYATASVVEGPESFGGGMEYPTITVISPASNGRELDNTIAHELGHNWFYGILATNERKHPWMDEGLNSFYEHRYMMPRYPHTSYRTEEMMLRTAIAQKKDQPIETPSEDFTEVNYGLIAYYKTARWMQAVEKYLGKTAFDSAMHAYYRQWQFRHPSPADLKQSLEASSGKNLDSLFGLLTKKGPLPGRPRKGVALWNPVNHIFGGLEDKNTVIAALPAIGFNKYDKLMVGAIITNLRLPPNRLQFLLIPLYATGSKKFSGIGFINHSTYTDGFIKKFDIGISASHFSADRFDDEAGNKNILRFTKWVPGVRLTLKEPTARSTRVRYVQFKSYQISEDGLQFYRDTVINGIDTTISTKYRTRETDRSLQQLTFVVENFRALYPYRGELKIESGKDFVRTAFTGKYFFNYPKGGGLSARLFAGKFFYTGSRTISKQFATDRYHLNMTGANGYEDYTYSDYFVGRNEFEGTSSQQIMVRDGAFKVRTDLLASKVGRTDDWLIALNLGTGIPKSINPLSLLPFDVPLKVFADIGTYSEPWKKNATGDRFLFDAGLQLSLFKETVNIYLPVMYSGVFKDYIQSTLPKKHRWLKTISFSIDISNFTFRKFDRNLDF